MPLKLHIHHITRGNFMKKTILFLCLILFSIKIFPADLDEIWVNKNGELLGVVINFDDYKIELSSFGYIGRIDILFDTKNIQDYSFLFGRITKHGKIEFRGSRVGGETDSTGYSPIKHSSYTRIEYKNFFDSRVWSIDNLKFDYKWEQGKYKRIRRIGDIEFEYQNWDQKKLRSVGKFRFSSSNDLKLTKIENIKTTDDFQIRVVVAR